MSTGTDQLCSIAVRHIQKTQLCSSLTLVQNIDKFRRTGYRPINIINCIFIIWRFNLPNAWRSSFQKLLLTCIANFIAKSELCASWDVDHFCNSMPTTTTWYFPHRRPLIQVYVNSQQVASCLSKLLFPSSLTTFVKSMPTQGASHVQIALQDHGNEH